MHKIAMNPFILEKARALRGGKPFMFDSLDPAKTAHIVVDLQNGFMVEGALVEVAAARDIVPDVNRISQAVRDAGGLNVFIQFTVDDGAKATWRIFFKDFADETRVAALTETFSEGKYGFEFYDGLDVRPGDLKVKKTRFGAFIPGTCDLHEILQARGIDTLIITGTCTNVCCESTARDAMQLNYKVIFVSDGNAAMSDEDHNATLNSMALVFADVMNTDEVVDVLGKSTEAKAAAE